SEAYCEQVSARGSGAAVVDHPLPTGRVVYEMTVVVTRHERHFKPSVRGVLGTNKEPKAESSDRESPGRGVVAAPMGNEPSEDEGYQPDAANPHRLCHIIAFTTLRWALGSLRLQTCSPKN